MKNISFFLNKLGYGWLEIIIDCTQKISFMNNLSIKIFKLLLIPILMVINSCNILSVNLSLINIVHVIGFYLLIIC